ncbi:hypothetical protein HHK36_026596 [Tetracentron sinense]|uniref:Uncharacterized protein n=1 Tax=Tetracentron sinense TaxID=13715 RepID=A0A835D5M2_TETSI|nr:hypothetical protein HHK36_026596 [Tetracentron sinense]
MASLRPLDCSNEMAPSHITEMEAAKFLQKLNQKTKDEPAKLARKLYLICQHMKLSGKEHSSIYQVVDRAMETVINQHSLDIECLKSSQLTLTGGTPIEDSGNERLMNKDATDNPPSIGGDGMAFKSAPVNAWHIGSGSRTKEDVYGGFTQGGEVWKDSIGCLAGNEMTKLEAVVPNRAPVGPSSVAHDIYQGSISQRTGTFFQNESPSNLITRCANPQERCNTAKQDKQGHKRESKNPSAKRKRTDSTTPVKVHTENPQKLDTPKTACNPRKRKLMNKGGPRGNFTTKVGEHVHINLVQNSDHTEHLSFLSGGMGAVLRPNQENKSITQRLMDSTKMPNSMPWAPTSKYLEEGGVSSTLSALGLKKGDFFPSTRDILSSRGVWNQNKVGLQSEISQVSRLSPNVVSSSSTAEISMPQLTARISKEAVTNRNEFQGNTNDFKLTENQTSEFSGKSSEGTDNFLQQQIVHYSAQPTGEGSLNNEAEVGGRGRSPRPMYSNISHVTTGISDGTGKFHGGMPAALGSYAMVKQKISVPIQFNSSSYDSHHLVSKIHKVKSMEAFPDFGLLEESKDMMATVTAVKSPTVELSSAKAAVDTEQWNHGTMNDAVISSSEKGMVAQLFSATRVEEASAPLSVGKVIKHNEGMPHTVFNTYKMVQVLVFSSVWFLLSGAELIDFNMAYFLTFFNVIEIFQYRSGNEDGAHRELTDHRGKELSLKEPSCSNEVSGAFGKTNDIRETERIPPASPSTRILVETDSSSKDTENPNMVKNKKDPPFDLSVLAEERNCLLAPQKNSEDEMTNLEMAKQQEVLTVTLNPEISKHSGKISAESNHENVDLGDVYQQIGKANHVCSSVANQHADSANLLLKHVPQWGNHTSKSESIISNSCDNAHVVGETCFPDDQKVSDIQKKLTSDGRKMVPLDETLKHGNSVTVLEKSTQQEVENDCHIQLDAVSEENSLLWTRIKGSQTEIEALKAETAGLRAEYSGLKAEVIELRTKMVSLESMNTLFKFVQARPVA